MAKHSIAFVTMIEGKAIDEFVDGLLCYLDQELGRKNYELIPQIGASCLEQFKSLARHQVVEEEVDLIIAAGDESSKAIFAVTSSRKRKTPMVFCGIKDPVKQGLIASTTSSGNHLTGVVFKSPVTLLPAQLVLRLNQGLEKLLIPYRPAQQSGRIAADAMRVQQYFENHGIKVTLYPIKQDTIDTTELTKQMKDHELAISIEGGLRANEINTVADIAASVDTPFWTDGEQATEHGAICAVRGDFFALGAAAGEQVVQILKHGKDPSDLPTRVLPSSRYIEINHDLVTKKGLILTDEVELGIDQALSGNLDLDTIWTLFIRRANNCFTQGLVGECTLRMRSDNTAAYFRDCLNEWFDHNEEEKAKTIKEFEYQLKKHAFIVLDDQIAHQVYQEQLAHGVKRPIVVITHAQDNPAPAWYYDADTHGIPVVRFFIPMPRLRDQLELLLATGTQVEAINLLLWGDARSPLLPEVQQQVAAFEDECTQRGITLNKHEVYDPNWYLEVPDGVIEPNSIWLFYENNMPQMIINTWSKKIREQNAICVSSNLGSARRFPLTIGIDYRVLSQTIHSMFKQSVHETRLTGAGDIILERAEFYRVNINRDLCHELNITPPSVDHDIMQYGTVTVDHSLETALVLNVLTIEEQQAINEKKKGRQKRRLRRAELRKT